MTPEAQDKLIRAASRWLGTPWRDNEGVPNGGVDCLRYVLSVWDEMDPSRQPFAVPPVRTDLKLYSPLQFFALQGQIFQHYDVTDVTGEVERGSLEPLPGDIIGLRDRHYALIGMVTNEYVWHVPQRGLAARRSPLSELKHLSHAKYLRHGNRGAW